MPYSSWKNQMYAQMERETKLDQAKSDSAFCCYRENMSKEELKKVLDFSQKDPTHAALPNMTGLKAEILRWDKSISDAQLKKARRYDLIGMLCRALEHTPRRYVSAQKFHRFGLSFSYQGPYPLPTYRDNMSSDELKAMLELHPNPKISVSQLKKHLRDYGSKCTGTKAELLKRLSNDMGCVDTKEMPWTVSTAVRCWEDEQPALQKQFDQERAAWQQELDGSKENAAAYKKSLNARKAIEDERVAKKQKLEAAAASRPWKAIPYNPNLKTQAQCEAEWKARHPTLSFPYSGAMIPPAHAFQDLRRDYLACRKKHAHHMLAYMLKGYGEFQFTTRDVSHKFMSKENLKLIHGRQCTQLGTSHHYAVEHLKEEVEDEATYRYQNGL